MLWSTFFGGKIMFSSLGFVERLRGVCSDQKAAKRQAGMAGVVAFFMSRFSEYRHGSCDLYPAGLGGA